MSGILTPTDRERLLAFLSLHADDEQLLSWAEDLKRHREGLRASLATLNRYLGATNTGELAKATPAPEPQAPNEPPAAAAPAADEPPGVAASRIGHKNRETILRLAAQAPRSDQAIAAAIRSPLPATQGLLKLLWQRGELSWKNQQWSKA